MNTPKWKLFAPIDSDQITSTLRQWREENPGLGVLAMVSENEPGAVATLQGVANAASVPLCGVVVPGLITPEGFIRKGALLLGLEERIPHTLVPLPVKGEYTDDSAVDELVAFVEDHLGAGDPSTLLLFIDSMTPDNNSLLDNLYLALGNQVHYAGTSVGSESFKPMPCVFDNNTFVDHAALALLLPKHPGARLAHHYRASASLGIATGTTHNRIATINCRPAFEIYQEIAASEFGVSLTEESFYRYATHFPLGLETAEGEPLVRIPVAVDEDGSIACVGEVRESSLMSVVTAPEPGNLETAQTVAELVNTTNPPAVCVFYCAGRRMHLGEENAAAELAHLGKSLAPTPMFGALSLGEIANYNGYGYPRFHNATIVALPWF